MELVVFVLGSMVKAVVFPSVNEANVEETLVSMIIDGVASVGLEAKEPMVVTVLLTR